MTNKHSEQHYQKKLEDISKERHEKYLFKKRKERFNLVKTFLRSRIDLFIENSNLDKQIIRKVENINSGYIITENSNGMEELINNIKSGNASQRVFECYSLMFSEYMCFKLIQCSLEIEKKNIIENETEFINKCDHFIIFNDPNFGWDINIHRLFESERITSYRNYMKNSAESLMLKNDKECEKVLRDSIDGIGGIGFSDNSFVIEYDDEKIPHDDENVIKFLNNKLSIIIRKKFNNIFDSKFEFKMPFDIKVNGEIFFLKENEK